jgi:uncharacterized protein (TIGR02118 family)
MIRVSVIYPHQQGAHFDWAYYTSMHVPMVARKLGAAAKAVSIEQGIAGGEPDSPPAFVALAHLTFESVPAFQAAFAPHADEIMGDIPNYTSIRPILQISEVKVGA